MTFVVSYAFEAWVIAAGGIAGAMGGFAPWVLMWIPALVSIAFRVGNVGGPHGWRDVGWRLGPWRLLGVSWLIPLLAASAAYGAAWAVGGVEFAVPEASKIQDPAGSFLASLGVVGTLGVLVGFGPVFGEELGWRGYLLTRLVDSRLPHPLLLGGLVWGVWHLPPESSPHRGLEASSPANSSC